MKKLLLILAVLCGPVLATVTVTPGPWDLYRGSTMLSSHASEAACAQAANALNVQQVYTCRTRSTVTVTVAPPPPPAPTLAFAANPSTVSRGSASILQWSSTNATSCAAGGAWSGNKDTSGSESSGALTAAASYSLSCTGSGGSITQSVTVTVSEPPPPGTRTGLDWDGTAPGRRMLYWSSPPAMFPATYLFKVFQRNQVSGIGDGSRYYTTFFWGNNGAFVWGSAYGTSYYGAHPYPIPENAGNGKWSIAAAANDLVTRDNGTSPYVTNNRWYSQAFVAQNIGGSTRQMRFYIDLPSIATSNRLTFTHTHGQDTPPQPALMFGQAPDNGSGLSWGDLSRWEEQNAVIRGIQVYATALTEAQAVALSVFETDADVLAYCAANGITPWYVNMNPTPTDVSDKSGNSRHPAWAGSARPTLWQQ